MQSDNSIQKIHNKIVGFLNQKQFQLAENYIEHCITFEKNSAHLWHLKSVIKQALGKIQECELSIKKALKCEPNHLGALANLAKLQTQNKQTAAAIKTYEKIINTTVNDISALFHLGVLLNKNNQFSEAKTYLKRAHHLNKLDINIQIALGQSHLNLEEFESALSLFNQVLEVHPNNIAALNNKGIVLKKQCEWKEAIVTLQKAIKISPKQTDIIKNLASCHTLNGDYNQSKSLYKQAVELSPLDIDAHHWLNQLLWENKDPEFLDSYRTSISQNHNANELMLSMGHKQYLAGNYGDAKETLEQALSINKKHVPTLVKMGVVLRELEEFDSSHNHLKQAVKYGNEGGLFNNSVSREELAISYLSLGKPKPALEILNKLLKTSPTDQGLWACKLIALKLLNSAEYDYYCNYDHVLITNIETPKGYANLKTFNEALVATLREYHHSKTNPLDQSLMSGSQTSEKLFDYHVPIIQELRQSFRDKTIDFLSKLPGDKKHPVLSKNTGNFIETDSWSVILHDNGFHKNHHHPAGWYSGPYYAQIPDVIGNNPDKQGWVKFGQPGFKMIDKLEPDIIVEPTEGLMVRFPSYYWHGTIPFNSSQERITVPGDIIPA